MNDLVRQLDQLTTAQTVEDLWNTHNKQMATYGFDRLLYGFTRYFSPGSLGDPQDWIILSTQTSEYMRGFVGTGLYADAPMLNWARVNNGACSWRWLTDMSIANNLTAGEMRVREFNHRMGVVAGYTVSFRSVSDRAKGAIGLTAKAGLTQDDVDEIWAKHGAAITVLNNVMHLKLLSLPHYGERELTKRQREVLQWVGDGKTTQDIALLLGLTPATVEKHLRLAREALDVETTAQAVLKAAFYNQMFVSDAEA